MDRLEPAGESGLSLGSTCSGMGDPSDHEDTSSAAATKPAITTPTGESTTSTPALPGTSGRATVPVVVAPMSVRGLRWARGDLPRSVPEPADALPSLLDDPPGRALVASYVPRPDGLGWAGEAIELYGVDRRWRRLSLGDLDLPPAGWAGYDTYGAGALSPDGRWWAGPMLSGFFLVDLRDGDVHVAEPVGRRYGEAGMATFSWSPDSDELVLIMRGGSSRVTLPDLRPTPFPRPATYPRLLADGGWIECPEVRRIVSSCTTYAADSSPRLVREVPADLQGRWHGPFDEVAGSVWFSLARSSYGNQGTDWEVAQTDDSFHVRSRLVLPRGSQINGVLPAFGPTSLGLAALQDRLLLAFLPGTGEIVRVLRTGSLSAVTAQDFWDVSFARDLVTVR